MPLNTRSIRTQKHTYNISKYAALRRVSHTPFMFSSSLYRGAVKSRWRHPAEGCNACPFPRRSFPPIPFLILILFLGVRKGAWEADKLLPFSGRMPGLSLLSLSGRRGATLRLEKGRRFAQIYTRMGSLWQGKQNIHGPRITPARCYGWYHTQTMVPLRSWPRIFRPRFTPRLEHGALPGRNMSFIPSVLHPCWENGTASALKRRGAVSGVDEKTVQRPSFWAVLPATVRYDTRLRPNAKLLYAEITALQEASGFCFASNRFLSDNFGLKPETITSLLNNLADAGYITVEVLRDKATNAVIQRRIYTTGKLPEVSGPSPKNIGDSSKNIWDPPRKISEENNTSNNIPPKAPQGGRPRKGHREPKACPDWKPERFNGFWAFYPRGENKQGAIRAWDKLKPSDELIGRMGLALAAQKQTAAWLEGVGIPYASTWLNNRRWEDEVKPTLTSKSTTGRGETEEWGW